jgi:hypothetical protein
MPFRSMSSQSLQWFLMANTAHLFGFTTYAHMKLHVMLLKRLQDPDDWFLLSAHIPRVCAKMGRHNYPFNDIFYVIIIFLNKSNIFFYKKVYKESDKIKYIFMFRGGLI